MLPHPKLIEEANEFGFNLDPKDFKATLQKAKSKLTKLKHQISIIMKDEEVEEKKSDFDATIVQIEKYQGYNFPDNMTVKKFANIYKSYKDGKNNV
jgi:multidrug resistance efflux pump